MSRLERDRAAALAASKASQAKAKRENAAHKCDGTIFGDYRQYRCGVTAKYEHEGSWYCKTHHPPTVKAKDAARSAKFRAKLDAERDAAQAKKLAADEQKQRADCYDDLLEALRLIATAENSALDLAYCKGIARAAIAKATGEQP
mgnify:CR=1 FL=1